MQEVLDVLATASGGLGVGQWALAAVEAGLTAGEVI